MRQSPSAIFSSLGRHMKATSTVLLSLTLGADATYVDSHMPTLVDALGTGARRWPGGIGVLVCWGGGVIDGDRLGHRAWVVGRDGSCRAAAIDESAAMAPEQRRHRSPPWSA